MKELPDFSELADAETSSITRKLNTTEEVIKRLLVNIAAFKKIEEDNIMLREEIVKNQRLLKEDYKKKLDGLLVSLRDKQGLDSKIKIEAIEKNKILFNRLIKELGRERKEKESLLKRYQALFTLAKSSFDENAKLKDILKNNREILNDEIERRIGNVGNKLKEASLLHEKKHKSLLKEHEEIKIELNKRLVMEKRKTQHLEAKHKELFLAFKNVNEDYGRIQKLNQKLISRLAELEKRSLANEDILKARTLMIKDAFEKKVKELLKSQIDREVGYKAKISSLSKDLSRYYEDLKTSKQRYYAREKELKEKLNQILNP